MSKIASFLSGNAAVVGGGAAAAAVVVVVATTTDLFKGAPDDPVVVETPTTQIVPEPVSEPVADAPKPEDTTEPAVEVEETPKAVAGDTTPIADPEQQASPAVVPAFDVVRVEPDGRTLVAGTGAPNGEIAILLNSAEIAIASTDGAGKFVSFVDLEPSTSARVMSLLQKGEGGVASLGTVIIAPTKVEVAAVAEPVTEQPTEADAEQEVETTVATVTETDTTEAAEPETPVTTTVLLKDEEGVKLLQSPNDVAPEVMSTVALDTISYSEEGDVQLAGRSAREGFVQVYLDNTPITSSRIEADGNWRMELPDVDTGVYTLRVDEVNEEGNVVSRVETPFKREDQETLQEVTSDSEGTSAEVVTVQPGSTLWAIADARYGDGVLYVRVFEANKDRIRDPDLIYPGQVFNLPQE